jgi:carbon monoxide dehydrogenase subunit G
MRYTDVRQVPGQREDVWQALHDIEVLRAGLPGCEELIPLGHDEYVAILATGDDTYRGLLTLADTSPCSQLAMQLDGRGRSGSLEVGLDVLLRDGRVPGMTSLVYRARVHLGGTGAQPLRSAADIVAPFFPQLGSPMTAARPVIGPGVAPGQP